MKLIFEANTIYIKNLFILEQENDILLEYYVVELCFFKNINIGFSILFVLVVLLKELKYSIILKYIRI